MDDLKVLKIRLLGFGQKCYPFRYAFSLSQDFFVLFAKTTCLQKSDPWVMIQKPQNAGFFKPQYLTKKWGIKLNFWMWLEVWKSTKYFIGCFSGCSQACLNMSNLTKNSESVLSQECIELINKVGFLHVLRSNRSNTFKHLKWSGQTCTKWFKTTRQNFYI